MGRKLLIAEIAGQVLFDRARSMRKPGEVVDPVRYVVELPPLHPLQQQVADSKARFKVLRCGRRWGKTHFAVLMAFREMLERGGAVMWVAPSASKTAIGWRLAESIASQIPLVKVLRGERRIVAPNGGWIMFASAESKGGLRGEGLTLAVVDEAAHIRGLDDIWQMELRPALSDRNGGGIFISTPLGHNFFYELWRYAEEKLDNEWEGWYFPTWSTGFVSDAEIEKARRGMPELVFRQEFGAEFVQLAGALFRREMFQVVDTVSSIDYAVRYWDIAVSTSNYSDYTTGLKLGHSARDGLYYALDLMRGRWNFPTMLQVIRQTALDDGAWVMQYVEEVGVQRGVSDMLIHDPALAGIPLRGHRPTTDKVLRAQPALAKFERGAVRLLRGGWNSAFIDELCAFPEGEHDDIVDAVSGAFEVIGRHKGGIYV